MEQHLLAAHLDALPSHDSRFATAREDIAKHRYANDDWDNDWIFSDDRFGLGRGADETLLRFLSETFTLLCARTSRRSRVS